jgi:hypothetical protein
MSMRMSEEGADVVGIMAGVALILCGMIWFLSPSPMQICIKAGYEWRGGDCVIGVDHD